MDSFSSLVELHENNSEVELDNGTCDELSDVDDDDEFEKVLIFIYMFWACL